MIRRRWFIALFWMALALASVRAIAPIYIEYRINSAIAYAGDLEGGVLDVDLHLLRGAYTLSGLELYAANGEQKRPLLAVSRLDITLAWTPLFQGTLLSNMFFHEPEINFQDRRTDSFASDNALTSSKTWIGLSDVLVPFTINRLSVISGRLNLYLGDNHGQHALEITNIHGELGELSNNCDGRLANIDARALLYSSAKVTLAGQFDPNTQLPTFDLDLTLAQVAVEHISPVIEFYAPFDVEAGTAKFAIEMKSEEGQVSGYARLGVSDLSLFSFEEDVLNDGDNLLLLMAEALSDLMAGALENGRSDQIATRARLSGELNDVHTPVLPALWGLIENAFIRAYTVEIEQSVSFVSHD